MARESNNNIAYNVKGLCEVYVEKYKNYFDKGTNVKIKVDEQIYECHPSKFIATMVNIFLNDNLMEKSDHITFEIDNKVLDSIQINH